MAEGHLPLASYHILDVTQSHLKKFRNLLEDELDRLTEQAVLDGQPEKANQGMGAFIQAMLKENDRNFREMHERRMAARTQARKVH